MKKKVNLKKNDMAYEGIENVVSWRKNLIRNGRNKE